MPAVMNVGLSSSDDDDEQTVAELEAALAAAKAKRQKKAAASGSGSQTSEQSAVPSLKSEASGATDASWDTVEHGRVAAAVAAYEKNTAVAADQFAPSTPPTASELDRRAAVAAAAADAAAATAQAAAVVAAKASAPTASAAQPDTTPTCRYYTVRDGNFYDLSGQHQSSKWAKRMRQKALSEDTAMGSKSGAGSSGGDGGDAKGKVEGAAWRLPAVLEAGTGA